MNHKESHTFNFNPSHYSFHDLLLSHYISDNLTTADNGLIYLHKSLANLNKEDMDECISIKKIGVNDRNNVYLRSFYNMIQSKNEFMETYKRFIHDHVKTLYDEEEHILYQKIPNLRISFPGNSAIGRREGDPSDDIIGFHCDGEFGHSPEEINYIIPLTSMYETNSIYFQETVNSDKTDFDNYMNLRLNKNEYFQGYFNQLYHYNKINNEPTTRISLDIRVIPYSKYVETNATSVSTNTKFILGEYFELM